ncbi:pyrroline-5-carboxylate reductase family protein [Methanobacterium alcaliphilum]|uniref:pyrroline-5-carboxylate reductase family protein n=1 Tax=Methanobacterium alcaliphilum TaxID=392018 RepID=UPI00200B9F2C|nr:pyrroline-5-carboxylate reductase dimerization domain-containing protein [Methanobacterium alcaliphilum]MCK9152392.1 NAD(P)-binding domain-containing protein [Methanobacterium alcaliphilum]
MVRNKLKIGFIGYGSMGSMIINGLLKSNALCPDRIIISTRTREKLIDLKREYPEIEIADNNRSLAEKIDKIFLFVTTGEVINVIEEIKESLSKDVHIIHISAGMDMSTFSTVFHGKVTQIIPSLTSAAFEGVSLLLHNQEVSESEKKYLEELFENISIVKTVQESDLRIGTDLTSCAPAFWAFLAMKFADIGAEKSGIPKKDARDMVIQTLYGTAKLMANEDWDPDEIISRVATPGGITEEGLKILDEDIGPVFNRLFHATSSKINTVRNGLK